MWGSFQDNQTQSQGLVQASLLMKCGRDIVGFQWDGGGAGGE